MPIILAATAGGAAIIIKTSINHSQNEPFSRWKVQIASVSIQTNCGIVRIASLYLPPNEPWSKADFDQLLISMGNKFVAGGDFNAKHSWWGNIRSNYRGDRLQEAIVSSTCQVLATGDPTFYSFNTQLTPTALDFFIFNGIPSNRLSVERRYELSSPAYHSCFTPSSTNPVSQATDTLTWTFR